VNLVTKYNDGGFSYIFFHAAKSLQKKKVPQGFFHLRLVVR
jgi:hypothetical protein